MYDTIIKYQNALNAGDTKTILGLFADESYSQWNDKLTADNTEKRQGQYDDLFKREKFETDFAFDSIWINGDTAVVRTHHHVGSVVTNFKEQKTIIDLNREVFVLSKINGEWKIFFIPSTPTASGRGMIIISRETWLIYNIWSLLCLFPDVILFRMPF